MAGIENNPTVVSLKKAIEDLDQIQVQRSKVMEEAVQKIQNYNAIEDLMMVN